MSGLGEERTADSGRREAAVKNRNSMMLDWLIG